MTLVPRAQEIYRHFKGNLYQIVTVAEHTETGEALVVYQALYGEFKIYARPLSMFCSRVDKEKYPDAMQEFRFELQSITKKAVKEEYAEQPVKQEVVEEAAEQKPDEEPMKQESAEEALKQKTAEEEPADLDPMLLAFLDAETYADKLNILSGIHHRITDDMITTMAIASDIEIAEGELENRYIQLKNCLLTREKYEIPR